MGNNISVIVPVYECENWILDKVKEFEQLVIDIDGCEVVFVDDGSQDSTVDVLKKYLSSKKNIRVIQLQKNSGKGAAVMMGMMEVDSEYRIFTDCDLSYPVTEIKKIYRELVSDKSVGAVIANRRHSKSICELNPKDFKHVYSRERSGRILNRMLKLARLTIYDDTQAGLKGFRGEVVNELPPISVYRFGFDIELLMLVRDKGHKIKQIPVRYIYHDNESTVGIVSDGIKIILDSMKIILNRFYGKYK